MMMKTTTKTITSITGRYSYDPGLSGADEANATRISFAVTRAGLTAELLLAAIPTRNQ